MWDQVHHRLQALAGYAHSLEEPGVVLQAVIEPIVLGLEPDKNPGGLAVTRNHDFLGRGETQIPREIILDGRERDLTVRACRTGRATLALGPSR